MRNPYSGMDGGAREGDDDDDDGDDCRGILPGVKMGL
jgi:hypothetical protein